VKEIANRPSNNPIREEEDITAFRSCAPGLPAYKLGGGLLKECFNLEIKNGRLRSRDKLKLYHDGRKMPDFEAEPLGKKFFTIPYNGTERKYWISYASVPNNNLNEIFYLNGNEWVSIYRYVGNGYADLSNFNAFRLNNLWNTNLWVLSIADGHSLVLVNDSEPRVRNMGLANSLSMRGEIFSGQDNCRSFGFDLIEKREGIPIRSSGVKTQFEMDGFTTREIYLNLGNPPKEATHIRLWLSDKIRVDNDEDEDDDESGGSNADPNALYPMIDFDLEYWKSASVGTTLTKDEQGRNNFYFFAQKLNANDYRISFDERGERMEPSFMGIEASTVETMNLIPMPNAQCLFNGILFGVSSGAGGSPGGGSDILYSSNPGTIFQEQTTALKRLAAGVGTELKIVAMSTGVLVFGTKGIARVSSLGGGDFGISKITSLNLSGMQCVALPGLGAVCIGKGRMIFIDQNAFETSDTLRGLPIADMLGDLANDIQAMNVADNKLFVIAGDGGNVENNRLFSIDLDNGAMTEMHMMQCYPIDLFSNDNSSIRVTGKYRGNVINPIVVSSEGNTFEEHLEYHATFCESSLYGFVQHSSTQVLARLGKCEYLEATVKDSPRREPNQFMELKNKYANDYQDYFIPADKSDIGNSAKAVEVTLYFGSNAATEGDNDGLEILAVKLSRLRQEGVSSPSFNSGGG
jgi:hypothetical protein